MLTQVQIKEIAEMLDCGFRCFLNTQNDETLFIPDTLHYPELESEAWDEELQKLDDNFSDYVEFESLESSDSFQIMASFVDTLKDSNPLKSALSRALSNSKPFRGFKFLVDNSGDYRQAWFDFKNIELEARVTEKLKRIYNRHP